MTTIFITDDSIAAGHAAFFYHVSDALTGTLPAHSTVLPSRQVNCAELVPGAAIACVAFGISDHRSVVTAVSQVTGCQREIVSDFLQAVTGPDSNRRIFVLDRDDLVLHPGPVGADLPGFQIPEHA